MPRTELRALRAVLAFASVSLAAACAAEDVSPTANLAGATIDSFGSGADLDGDGQPDSPAPTDVPPPPPGCPEDRWCSSLYPPDWTPDAPAAADGRFLHDFSFAGYRYGEQPPAAPPGATYDVAARYGADPTGAADSTSAIQTAINDASAAGGGVVFFREGTYKVGERLMVEASGVVLKGTGAKSVLRFTKPTGMANKAHLTFKGAVTRDAGRALAVDAPARAKEIFLTDAAGLAAGDDVAIGWTISPAFVEEHGMTGTWKAFNGKHVPFFRSKVVAVDTSVTPHRVELDVPLRYTAKVRDAASVQKETGYLSEVGVQNLAVTNALTWQQAWAEHQVNVITMLDVKDAWIDDVHSVPSPGATGRSANDDRVYHLRSNGVRVENSKRVSVLRSSMENPQNRGSGGNGYLFEVSRTAEVLIADSVARNGRHNFIQNWGFGNAGTVFLRCTSSGSEMLSMIRGTLTPEPAYSEHHHSLAMATLVDDCELDDGFASENRRDWSTGAGHTATDSVVWRASGKGKIISKQHGWGYVIGTQGVEVDTRVETNGGTATGQEDFVEGQEHGADLFPASLYEDQRTRRVTK